MRKIFVGGVVSGSVSITVAKNNIEVFANSLQRFEKISEMTTVCKLRLTITVVIIKLINKSNRCIFLTINNPTISTKIKSDDVPTHQLADWPSVSAVMATAIATGLKICFFRIAIKYFDTMAITDAHIAIEKNCKSVGLDIGDIIKAKIMPVIYTDSVFVGALNPQAKIIFIARQTVIINNVENKIAKGLYGNI